MPPPPRPQADLQGTRLETGDEIRRALAERGLLPAEAPTAPAPPPAVARPRSAAAPVAAPAAEPEVRTERPVLRPPMALLVILDDGRSDGEIVRLRADCTLLGRADGDIRIPHDGQISSRHAEILRQQTATGGYRWILSDLQSTNGTFVRIGTSILRDGMELLIGQGRFRFELPESQPRPAAQAQAPDTTRGWGERPTQLLPALVELSPTGGRFPLERGEYWIGRDAQQCAIARVSDPLVNARHARLYHDDKGWHIENHRSTNGLWLRIDQIALGDSCQFRLGEQRFLFRVLE